MDNVDIETHAELRVLKQALLDEYHLHHVGTFFDVPEKPENFEHTYQCLLKQFDDVTNVHVQQESYQQHVSYVVGTLIKNITNEIKSPDYQLALLRRIRFNEFAYEKHTMTFIEQVNKINAAKELYLMNCANGNYDTSMIRPHDSIATVSARYVAKCVGWRKRHLQHLCKLLRICRNCANAYKYLQEENDRYVAVVQSHNEVLAHVKQVFESVAPEQNFPQWGHIVLDIIDNKDVLSDAQVLRTRSVGASIKRQLGILRPYEFKKRVKAGCKNTTKADNHVDELLEEDLLHELENRLLPFASVSSPNEANVNQCDLNAYLGYDGVEKHNEDWVEDVINQDHVMESDEPSMHRSGSKRKRFQFAKSGRPLIINEAQPFGCIQPDKVRRQKRKMVKFNNNLLGA